MLPDREEAEREKTYRDRHRPFLFLLVVKRDYRKDSYQKLFGLYLFATTNIAILESSSIGYTP